jgi:hypothetical protein
LPAIYSSIRRAETLYNATPTVGKQFIRNVPPSPVNFSKI